jgi:hypothetical protein
MRFDGAPSKCIGSSRSSDAGVDGGGIFKGKIGNPLRMSRLDLRYRFSDMPISAFHLSA